MSSTDDNWLIQLTAYIEVSLPLRISNNLKTLKILLANASKHICFQRAT